MLFGCFSWCGGRATAKTPQTFSGPQGFDNEVEMVPETTKERREERKEQRRERRERHRGEKWSILVTVCVSRVTEGGVGKIDPPLDCQGLGL